MFSCRPVIQILKWIWNTIYHQCLAVILIYATWTAMVHCSNQFSWHVILCTWGIIPLSAEALILFSDSNVWSQEIAGKYKYLIHGTVMVIAILLIITGIALEIDRKEKLSLSHFSTAHGVFGLLCMIFFIFALTCGPFAFAATSNRFSKSIWLELAHNILGQMAFIMGIFALCFAYFTDFFEFYNSEKSRVTSTVVTAIMAIWTLCYSWKSLYHLIKSIIH